MKSQMSGKSAEIRKHETKPSDLDEKNQSFVGNNLIFTKFFIKINSYINIYNNLKNNF